MSKMSLKESLKLATGYVFRWVGFSTEPRLLEVGNPTPEDPVFLTCNFNLTVKRVLKAVEGMDCFLLVAPSNGINVWCGACGDDFDTNSVLSILKTSKIGERVSHRTLILPQLSAPGIDPDLIKKKTGWIAKFGPVRAEDIPAYVERGFEKTQTQREVTFPITKRIEMGNLYFLSLLILLSPIYWVLSLFLPFFTLTLYLSSVLTSIGVIHGSLILSTRFNSLSGKLKVLIHETLIIGAITAFNLFLWFNLLYLIWNVVLSILLALLMMEDLHGLTPIYKSELGEKSWEKGKTTMSFLFDEFALQPYGEIQMETAKCIGCKACIDVCPRAVFEFDEGNNKANILEPDRCINCHACTHRCLGNCLRIR